jgi:hypothetical protein
MKPNAMRWLRSGTLWVWLVFAAALVVTAACTDVNVPPVTKELDDTLQDSLNHAG